MRREGVSSWTGTRVALLVVLGIVALAARPWDCYTKYECAYCHAQLTRHWVIFIQLPGPVREGKLCRYWRTNVDPHHRHVWRWLSQMNAGLNRQCADSNEHGMLAWTPKRERANIAMLKSLPTPAARKAIVERCVRSSPLDWDYTISNYLPKPSQTKP